MGWNRVLLFLLCFLLVLNIFMAVIVYSYQRETSEIPQTALDDMEQLLGSDGIYIDKGALQSELIESKIISGNLPADIHEIVAASISGSSVERTYSVPDGVILIMDNGDRYTFGRAFEFTLVKSDAQPSVMGNTEGFEACSRKELRKLEKLLRETLEIHISAVMPGLSFDWSVKTASINKETGMWFITVLQSYHGFPLIGCQLTAEGDSSGVSRISGGWCFAPAGAEQESQLLDQLNALYIVRGIVLDKQNALARTIKDVSLCYYPYVTPLNESYTLIPAWKVTMVSGDEYVLNAVDGSRCE